GSIRPGPRRLPSPYVLANIEGVGPRVKSWRVGECHRKGSEHVWKSCTTLSTRCRRLAALPPTGWVRVIDVDESLRRSHAVASSRPGVTGRQRSPGGGRHRVRLPYCGPGQAEGLMSRDPLR